MINLEWFRTFITVYKTKSLSTAAKLLRISQPTVSQQLFTLEAHLEHKLFTRKSKGVIETDEGRILFSLVSNSIESLENIENLISKKDAHRSEIMHFGISEHLFHNILDKKIAKLGDYVHIKFGKKQDLIKELENGNLHYAVLPDWNSTTDISCYPLCNQKLVLVSSPDIDLKEFSSIFKSNKLESEQWLTKYKWFAHDSAAGFIKLFWIHMYDKKKLTFLPNYIIPNEFELLNQLSKSHGLTIALDTNAAPLIKSSKLNSIEVEEIPFRQLFLAENNNKTHEKTTEKILSILI